MKTFPVIEYIHDKHIVRDRVSCSSVYSVKMIRMDDLDDWPWFLAELFIFDLFGWITPSKYRVEVSTEKGVYRSCIKNKKYELRYIDEIKKSDPDFDALLKDISFRV
ncbi:MAG: hypothetical protein C0602_05990 [Denitrovibrio sp.]|nr:MAG: hypothetical protein C0602_05990 [Denitrovibrio sp.]